jgi:hypothetical protein
MSMWFKKYLCVLKIRLMHFEKQYIFYKFMPGLNGEPWGHLRAGWGWRVGPADPYPEHLIAFSLLCSSKVVAGCGPLNCHHCCVHGRGVGLPCFPTILFLCIYTDRSEKKIEGKNQLRKSLSRVLVYLLFSSSVRFHLIIVLSLRTWNMFHVRIVL